MKVWKMIFLFKEVICRIHVNFPGCSIIFFDFWRWNHRSLRESDFSNMYWWVRSKIEPYNHMSYSECVQYLEFRSDNMTQNTSQKDKGRIGDFLCKFQKSIGNSSFKQKSIQTKNPSTQKNPSIWDNIQKSIHCWLLSQNLHWQKSPAFRRLQKLTWKNSWSTLGRWGFCLLTLFVVFFFSGNLSGSGTFFGLKNNCVCVFF